MPDNQQDQFVVVEEKETPTESRGWRLFTDILTIIGLAILFIIIIWGLIHLVELVVSSYSGNQPAPTIQVVAPAQATAGKSVTVSWNYSPSKPGSYAFLYECQSGLSFQSSSTKTSEIPCGVAYTIGDATSSLSLIPELSATSSVSDTVSIVFIPSNAGSQVQGDAAITINPASAAAPVKTLPVKTPTASYVAPQQAGPAQLAVSIISGNINASGDGTVTFNIANVGESTSGSYTFSAILPTAQAYPYVSPEQAPLAPGAHVVSTLSFTNARSGGGLFSVTIEGADANSSSDSASMEIPGPYAYNGYNNYTEPDTVYPSYNY